MIRRRLPLALLLALAPVLAWADEPTPPAVAARAAQGLLDAAHEHIVDHSFAKAREELARLPAEEPIVRLEEGRLALYEERCDDATRTLAAPEVTPLGDAKDLLEIAQGCARVTAATPERVDAEARIAVRFQDPDDAPLFADIVATAAAARAMLTKELGVDWPSTLRITVVRDHLSLAAMTGLPYESARTTGTVAVAKWGRVTILSPRAPRHGYAFRDTLAHELTHLAVTRATADRAPLWLQEGLAKRQEIRWRGPGPFDARISPEAVAKRGDALKLTLPLDKLGPSIAMLPSADQAVVVFAEVTSFVKFLVQTLPEGGLPKLLQALRAAPNPSPAGVADGGGEGPDRVDGALTAATGAGLSAWDKRWRTWLAAQPTGPLSATLGLQGAAPDPSLDRVPATARLATLLLARGHAEAAAAELASIAGKLDDDPALRTLRARALAANGKDAEARALLADPAAVLSAHGPFFALRGRLAQAAGDATLAASSFDAALAEDPLAVETACRSLSPEGYVASPLCASAVARRLAEPYGD